jgi:tRNA pseudouridine synthase 10
MIYRISATYLNSHFAMVTLEAQAGTYIKEFIHGDLGRTKPSFGDLMKRTVDIMQLDV